MSSNEFEVILGNLDDEDFVITLSCTGGIPNHNKLSESIYTNEALSSTPLPNNQTSFEQMLGTQYLVHVANVAELYVLLVVIEDLLTEMMEEKEHQTSRDNWDNVIPLKLEIAYWHLSLPSLAHSIPISGEGNPN